MMIMIRIVITIIVVSMILYILETGERGPEASVGTSATSILLARDPVAVCDPCQLCERARHDKPHPCFLLLSLLLANARQCSPMLANARQCSPMLGLSGRTRTRGRSCPRPRSSAPIGHPRPAVSCRQRWMSARLLNLLLLLLLLLLPTPLQPPRAPVPPLLLQVTNPIDGTRSARKVGRTRDARQCFGLQP